MAIFKIIFSLSFFMFFGCATLKVSQDTTLNAPNLRVFDLDEQFFDAHSFFAHHDATVLIWWASKCPCVVRYQSRMQELAQRQFGKKVAVLAVSSNADDSNEIVLKEIKKRDFKVPIIRDVHGDLAQYVGAATTPTAAIIGPDGAVKFIGWIDNECLLGDPKRQAYLDDALRELLAGMPVSKPYAPFWGCMITKKLLND